MSRIVVKGSVALLGIFLIAAELGAQEPRPPGHRLRGGHRRGRRRWPQRGRPSQFRDFNEVTRGAEKIEGLFTLHKTGDHLYAEIRPDQFNQTLLRADHDRARPGLGRHSRSATTTPC